MTDVTEGAAASPQRPSALSSARNPSADEDDVVHEGYLQLQQEAVGCCGARRRSEIYAVGYSDGRLRCFKSRSDARAGQRRLLSNFSASSTEELIVRKLQAPQPFILEFLLEVFDKAVAIEEGERRVCELHVGLNTDSEWHAWQLMQPAPTSSSSHIEGS